MLNEQEKQVLGSVVLEISLCTSCQFGYAEDVKNSNFTKNQIKGYLSQLLQKGYITICEEEGQMNITEACIKEFGKELQCENFETLI